MTRAAAAPVFLAGCGGEEAPADVPPATAAAPTSAVRGVYLGPAYEGRSATVRHEAVPGSMPAMQMGLHVAELAGGAR